MEMKDIALLIALIAVAGTLVFVLLRRKPREEGRGEEVSREDIEAYEEALRLARQQIEEKEQEIEKLKKSFRYRLMCPHCGNLVTPAITEDNRLICPVLP